MRARNGRGTQAREQTEALRTRTNGRPESRNTLHAGEAARAGLTIGMRENDVAR